MELVVLAVASVALGIVRPRWSTLLAALAPVPLAFAWFVMHEDVPGDPLGLVDLAWYAGMSLAVGAVFTLPLAGGIVLGRKRLTWRSS